MGLYGVLVVTDNDTTVLTSPNAYGTAFDQDVALLLSEIDPEQNDAVNTAVTTTGFTDTAAWNGQTGQCGDPAVHTCYPPVVNYKPQYYLINGAAFDRSNINGSTRTILAPVSPATTVASSTGKVLVRFVNAGLRFHVPSIVGAPMTLLAEDGNKLPGNGARVQNSVLLTAGKTYDVTIQPAVTTGNYTAATYAVFDRELSLSTANQRDGGMQAYISVAGGATSGVGSAASGTNLAAQPDTTSGPASYTYYCSAGTTLSISDPSKGLLAGATGASGVVLGTTFTGDTTAATVALQSNGTFTYTPTPGTTCGGSFAFLLNGTLSKTATIAQCDGNSSSATGCALAAAPTVVNNTFLSNVYARYASSSPGVLAGATGGGIGVTAVVAGTANAGITLNPDGSFVATQGTSTSATCPTMTPALPTGTFCTSFQFQAKTSQGQPSNTGTAYVAFLPASKLAVNLVDAKTGAPIGDYRWMIEEDKTFWIDPKCQVNTTGTRTDSQGKACAPLPVESLGYNFHTAHMPVIAQGCVGTASCEQGQMVTDTDPASATFGQHVPGACDIGDGICHPVDSGQKTPVDPGSVYLDPNKRYFISILPGDGVNPTIGGPGVASGTAALKQTGTTVTLTNPAGFSGVVVGDRISLSDSTVNAANAASCVVATVGASTLTCRVPTSVSGTQTSVTSASYANTRSFDVAKDCGPYTGPTGAWEPAGSDAMCGHEMGGAQIAPGQHAVNIAVQETPLPTAKISVMVFEDDNPLNGEQDAGGGVDVLAPNEAGLGGFEIKLFDQAGQLGDNTGQITYDEFNMPVSNSLAGTIDPITRLDACPITARTDGLVGMVPTCPKYESDGRTQSPLAGQAVIANLYPGLYEVQSYPAADRIARGEEWLQTNTLDGGKPHEAFIKPNEPGYFQEFGPGGFHVAIGYANPVIVNARKDAYCASALNGGGTGAQTCDKTLTVHISNNHMSRTPDQRTYSSETYDHYSFTNCYVSIGPADAADFAFAKCSPDGTAVFKNIPNGTYKISVFDQWNDIMLDGLVGTVSVSGNTEKSFPVTQWRTNLSTRTFIDSNGDGVSQDSESGLALVNTNIRYRDGSFAFFNNTDLNGNAGFNEVFPFMNWLVVDTSTTRFKPTGVHSVYDAGGPVDCSNTGQTG